MKKKKEKITPTYNIKGGDYEVMFDNPKHHEDSDWSGLCKKFEKKIYVDENLSPAGKIITLLHEWGHALLHEISVDDVINGDTEEIIVDNFAKEMYKVFFERKSIYEIMLGIAEASTKKGKKNGRK